MTSGIKTLVILCLLPFWRTHANEFFGEPTIGSFLLSKNRLLYLNIKRSEGHYEIYVDELPKEPAIGVRGPTESKRVAALRSGEYIQRVYCDPDRETVGLLVWAERLQSQLFYSRMIILCRGQSSEKSSSGAIVALQIKPVDNAEKYPPSAPNGAVLAILNIERKGKDFILRLFSSHQDAAGTLNSLITSEKWMQASALE